MVKLGPKISYSVVVCRADACSPKGKSFYYVSVDICTSLEVGPRMMWQCRGTAGTQPPGVCILWFVACSSQSFSLGN